MNKKTVFLFIALFIVFLLYLLLKPFLTAILGSLILTFIFHPFFIFLNHKIKNKHICSALTIFVILLIIMIPSFFLINSLAQESVSVYHKLKTQQISSLISTYVESSQLQEYLGSIVNNALLFIINSTSNFILSIPHFALTFFVVLFLTYYLLKESDKFQEYLSKCSPFKEDKQKLLIERFKKITNALIYGTILTALIQGFIGGLAFLIFGISSPILWGFIIALVSIIPLVGTALIWFPAGLIQLFQQDYVSGIGLLLVGSLIISTADNFIKPKLVGKKANIHPAVVLIGVLGGLKLMGFLGLILGPLILALSIELFKLRGEFF